MDSSQRAGESPAALEESRNARGQHWGGCPLEKRQKRGKAQRYARYSLGD
jgi:hypothetical protein